MRSPVTMTPSSSTCSTARSSRTSTPSSLRCLRAAAERLFGERSENTRARADQHDPRRCRIDAAEFRPKGDPAESRDRARHFDAGRAGADQDERQQIAVSRGVLLGLRPLECLQNFIADGDRVGEAFQTWRVLFKLIVTEVIVRGARSEYQVVVVDPHVIAIERH